MDRTISPITAAREEFDKFPLDVREIAMTALQIAARGIKTPREDMDRIRSRLTRLRGMLK